jgi:hypothetical protein
MCRHTLVKKEGEVKETTTALIPNSKSETEKKGRVHERK